MAIPIIGGLLKDVIGSVVGKAGDIVDQVVVDKDKKLQAKVDLERLKIEMTDSSEQRLHEQMMGQIGVNTEEAKSESIFVAGWRPAIGWVGAVGIGYSFVVEPIMSWGARVFANYDGTFPSLNYSELMILVAGMLGFGGFRSFEKVKGVAGQPPDDGGKPENLLPPSFDQTPEDAPWAR